MNLAARLFGLLLGKRLPRYDGELRVSCKRPLRLRRDQHGVAYVTAETEHDAWFGLGFCHAQDRAAQLEINLRLVRGTLSEVVGRDGLPIDRASRLIGVHQAARGQYALTAADVRAQIEAYCAGLNAALSHPSFPVSHEHRLLGIRPSAWQPEDVIAFGLMMCCLLPSNWDVELARLAILTEDGEDAVAALNPAYRADLPVTSPPGARAGVGPPFLANDLAALRQFIGHSGGSNAWAIDARKTERGLPLLANDPHLPASLPNLGYLAHVACPAFRVAGISIVGTPAFITGHNGHAAWGSTAAQLDNTDLFLEELGPDEVTAREGDRFVPCELREELIPVRGEPPVPLRIVITRRGPVVARRSDPAEGIFDPLPLPRTGRANALSFAATWLAERPTRAILSFHRLRSFSEFRELCAEATGCAYSMVYADPATIGWALAAEVPVRKHGHGSLPMPGYDADSGWEPEVVSGDRLPYAENPSAGFLCCANNRPVPESESTVFLGHDFLDGYRQERIGEVLAGRDDWTLERMAALQQDVLTLTWRETRERLLAVTATSAAAARALDLLRAWNGELSSESSAATVYEHWLAEICERACRSRAPRSFRIATGVGVMKLIPGTTFNARLASFVSSLIRDQPPGFFASWPEELESALETIASRLERELGNDTARWAWGLVRPLPLAHRFGEKKPLDRVFNRGPLPGYGDGTTVNQAGFEYWKPLRHSTVTAHLRAVIEVGDWSAARFVLLGGQSGNPLSPHYDDMIPLWQRGEGVPIRWDEPDVEAATRHVLVLSPTPLAAAAPTPRTTKARSARN